MRLNSKILIPNAIAVSVALLLFVTSYGRASAQEVDPSSSVRGSLGVPLSDLNLDNPLGVVSFFLNAGLTLLCSAVALYVVARARREWLSRRTRTLSAFPLLRKRTGASQVSLSR
jgi:hypothetical protein